MTEEAKSTAGKIPNAEKQKVWFFVCMLIAGAILITVYLCVTGNTPQVFRDVVTGETASDSSNKSAERNLYYLFAIVGAFFYGIYYFLTQKKHAGKSVELREWGGFHDSSLFVVVALLVFTSTYYFIYSSVNWMLISALLFVLVLCMVDRRLMIPGVAFLFMCVYAICGIYRIYVLLGGERSLSMMTNVLISLTASFILLYLQKRLQNNLYVKGIMLLQVIIPFVFLVYLMSNYRNGDEFININVPRRIQFLIYLLIGVCVVEAIRIIAKNWRNASVVVGNIISCGACVSIMAFNRYSGTGSIISTDLHHPFENIIGYSQIMELGQKAFSEYLPVSGMYSFVHGFFLALFGKGKVSYYYVTSNLFYLAAIILIVMLLKKQIKGEWLLFISIVFCVIDYDRVTFILPIMLLLACPKVIEKKNLWLKCWFVTSFFHGLYYPVFGAAVCLGFLPLGIWQIVSYARSGELKKDIRRAPFWIWWIICCAPVVLGFGLLLGSARHMMAMSGQTVYADGITRFGQAVPDNLVSYIQNQPIRLVIYYIFSYLILVSAVWMSVALGLGIGRVRHDKKKLLIGNPVAFGISLSFGIALLVSFSYTVIRVDINSVYARSAGVVYAAFAMLIIIVSRYMNQSRMKYCVFGFAVFLVAAVSAEGFFSMGAGAKLSAYYTVPDEYIYVENDQVDRFGTCFASQATYDSIENTYNSVQNRDRDRSYFGLGNFGMYYMCVLKGGATIETGTIRGYGAAQEIADLLRENGAIVGGISPVTNYYLYHWLLTSGEYVWSAGDRSLYPNDTGIPENEVLKQNKTADLTGDGFGMGRTPGSWGLSMKSLYDIFKDTEISCNINQLGDRTEISFSDTFDGDDADFLYLEFADMDKNYQYILFNHTVDAVQNVEEYPYAKPLMKKDYNAGMAVTVFWNDDAGVRHSINASMSQGKLLIPLGCGRGWLLNNHSNIEITVNQGEQVLPVPEIKDIKLLKLREVE